MKPDDPVCLCFHVTRRKIINFIRIEKPKRPSQLSQCFGAGTGCGWCRGYLERLLASEIEAQSTNNQLSPAAENKPVWEEISLDEYAQQRTRYVLEGGGTPPAGAIPIGENPDSPR
jgi:bacterioferritin-associated ferredoxin